MNNLIETVKREIAQHTVIPFTAKDIQCRAVNKQPTIIVADRYTAKDTKGIMNALGIKSNLEKDIFKNPEENWSLFQEAIESIDRKQQFACIVRDNTLCTMVKAKINEPAPLDFSDRLEALTNVIDQDEHQTLQNIVFNPNTVSVDIHSINGREIDAGMNDLWNFGTTTNINFVSQQFQQYFLRLVCTNGMTTRENIAYRVANASKNIGKQFLKFNSTSDMTGAILPRVKKLRNSRASLYEVCSVASNLKKADRDTFFPDYADMVTDFRDHGYVIDEIDAARRKHMYTNENMYDLFNLATYLATHQRPTIGANAAQALNKLAGEFFTNGPILSHNIVDIYSK